MLQMSRLIIETIQEIKVLENYSSGNFVLNEKMLSDLIKKQMNKNAQ